MTKSLPSPNLLLWANIFGLIAACHLIVNHILVMLFSMDEAWWKEHEYFTVNMSWTILHTWCFICTSLLLVHSYTHGDMANNLGNCIKMGAVVCWYMQDAFCFAQYDDQFLSSFIATSLFALGGAVHTYGFGRSNGFWNSTTLGIFCLMIGAAGQAVFFHIAFALRGGYMVDIGDPTMTRERVICTAFTLIADGIVIAGSGLLLGGVVDAIGSEKMEAATHQKLLPIAVAGQKIILDTTSEYLDEAELYTEYGSRVSRRSYASRSSYGGSASEAEETVKLPFFSKQTLF